MPKRIHLICNAHLDPVWQWEWEEGAAETLSTFRIAADFCEEFGDFVFNHNEALLYRWIEEYEPPLFKRIQKLVRAGKWHIMGGWHLQPDCNMPCGEGFVRQIQSGRRYFKEKFGVEPKTAINFDPFGHTRGLVQIMKKSGFDSYLFGRPTEEFIDLPNDLFTWVGYDGSEITARRQMGYNTGMGKATTKICRITGNCPDNDFDLCLWGVGNHGGGPSRQDLQAIAELQKELSEQGISLIHSTPEDYFNEVRASSKVLARFDRSLNPWAQGCYTSMIRVKQKYRALENTYLLTEQMSSAAVLHGTMEYPKKELEEALYDLLTVQFHDMLPGSSVQPAEEMALRMLDHGLEILSRVKARAFFALSGGQKKPAPDAIPILIYNPYPYPVESDFMCEMMLWDQNREDYFSKPIVLQNGNALPTQCEKENSSLPIDWRKRPVFHATLAPMQMNRFDCQYVKIPKKPEPSCKADAEYFYLENEHVCAKISRKTGYLEWYSVDGVTLIAEPCALHVIEDNCDPWGMTVNDFTDRIGQFALLSDEETTAFCGIKTTLQAVHCVESGAVRTVIESVLGYGRSRAVLRYTLSNRDNVLGVDIRLQWAETQKMVKLGLPTALTNAQFYGEQAYGEEALSTDGQEHCAQRYIQLENSTAALTVCTDSVYGNSAEGGTIYPTLLRSAAYCAHPIDDREILSQNRYTPHMEQGERQFSFLLLGGETAVVRERTPRLAQQMNMQPMALSFYPPESGTKPHPPILLEGDAVVQTAFKQAEDGNGFILRLFNPFDKATQVRLQSEAMQIDTTCTLGKFEIRTLRLQKGSVTENNLMED